MAMNAKSNSSHFRGEKETFRWEIIPGFKPLLATILADPGEIVKRSHLSSVTRHSLGGKTYYRKIYFHNATLAGSLKYFFKSPASRIEWQLAPQLQESGIRVVPHLAHGELWNWRGLQESILITEGPVGFEPLKLAAPSPVVQTALGRFLGHLHENAVFHSDLHTSNLLYSSRENEFCLVDLDNMRILPALSDQQRIDNLATLNRRWPLSANFFEAYGVNFQEFAGRIAERAEEKHRESIPKKLKILFADRALFAKKRFGNFKWHVRLHPWNEHLESILNDPDAFLATRARMLKNGTRSTVGCAHGLVLKRFNFKKPSTVVFDLFRSSRARRGFRTARHLELLKIATPRPIAYADVGRFGFVVRGYFVMEEVAGAAYPWQRTGDRKARIYLLAELVAKVHNEGFSHRDLKETNILFDAQDVPHLIDLDALHFVREISNKSAAVQLARLARGFARRGKISNPERLRFLKDYCRVRKINDWRWWWNEIGKNLTPDRQS